jgi:membrane protein CcdC involved in cytochrome C biogenesis
MENNLLLGILVAIFFSIIAFLTRDKKQKRPIAELSFLRLPTRLQKTQRIMIIFS